MCCLILVAAGGGAWTRVGVSTKRTLNACKLTGRRKVLVGGICGFGWVYELSNVLFSPVGSEIMLMNQSGVLMESIEGTDRV